MSVLMDYFFLIVMAMSLSLYIIFWTLINRKLKGAKEE